MFGPMREAMTVGKVDGVGGFWDGAARAAYLAGVLHLPVRDLKGR
ncbi:MAG TPA: hypothetical protein VG387_10860 [Rhizomicrobium sp.]|jgi:hypothetical protein|nr:hypothetical protein [Rhizomicrobium sp.]